MTCIVDRRALRGALDWMIAKLGAYLAELLLYFRGGPFNIGPVEADAGRAILQPMRAVKRREVRGQALLDRRAFPRLHLLPRLALPAFVQVWMTPAHFRDQPVRDVADVERAALLRHDRVEEHLQQDVAELLA